MTTLHSIARTGNPDDMPTAPRPHPEYTIVTQVKAHRVVYFTDDADYQPPMDGDWYYVSSFQGPLPDGMTLRNCWRWRFNGTAFVDAGEAPGRSRIEKLLDYNRGALQKLLREKIDTIRQPLLPSCLGGEALRQAKLAQANAYLRSESGADLAQLRAVAVARNMDLAQAAALVIRRANETQQALLETERFREQLAQAIESADNEQQLAELRSWLLDHVYPELSSAFKWRTDDTRPANPAASLSDVQRVHEIARLKAQLREAINAMRESLHSAYVLNEEVRKQKVRLAQTLVASRGVKQAGVDYCLLEGYAEGRQIPLLEAAQLLLKATAQAASVLQATECQKDRLLFRIENVLTYRELQEVEQEMKNLKQPPSSI